MASSLPGFLSFLWTAKSPPTTNLAIPSSPPSSSSRPQVPLAKPSPRLPQERDTSRSSDDFDISAVICPSLAHSNTLFFASSLCRTRMTSIPRSRSSDRSLPNAKIQSPTAKFLQSNPPEQPKPGEPRS